jgi:hypothetical protein
MSGENFLSRWSRRKREQEAVAAADPAQPDSASVTTASDASTPPAGGEIPAGRPPVPVDPANEPVDPAELPDLETMDVTNDLTPWLKRNVPDAWKQAALRKLWLTDPHVRAHVPFADYAWDWNTPGGVPGSGPLGPLDDVAKMAADILRGYGNPEPDVHSLATTDLERTNRGEMSHMRQPGEAATHTGAATDRAEPAVDVAPQQEMAALQPVALAPELPLIQAVRRSSEPMPARREALPAPPSLAPQQADGAQDKGRRRRHGGALPE